MSAAAHAVLLKICRINTYFDGTGTAAKEGAHVILLPDWHTNGTVVVELGVAEQALNEPGYRALV